MSILKSLDRAKRMDDLIRRRATGTTREFASKLGISRRMLMLNLGELKELGATIGYDKVCQSYYYEGEFSFFFHNREAMNKIRGGEIPSLFFQGAMALHPDDLYLPL